MYSILNHTNKECLGIELDDEDLDAMLETYIVETIKEHGELNQQELISKVKAKALYGNEHNIRTLLQAMAVKKDRLDTKPGIGKSIIYYIPKQLVESKSE